MVVSYLSVNQTFYKLFYYESYTVARRWNSESGVRWEEARRTTSFLYWGVLETC